MNIWGSIPDWLSFFVALISLINLFAVERAKSNPEICNSNSTPCYEVVQSKIEDYLPGLKETDIEFRAALYSRALIGIIFGIALSPTLSWLSIKFFSHNDYDFSFRSNAESTLIILFSIFLSIFLTLIYFRTYQKWTTIFVRWAERFAISYISFFVIVSIFSYWGYHSDLKIYYINSYRFVNIPICIIMFILISFSSTPIDWIINLKNKSKETKK